MSMVATRRTVKGRNHWSSLSGTPWGNRACFAKPRPSSQHFPFEPIYTYPLVYRRGSQTEYLDINIVFVCAAAFSRILKETHSKLFLICAVSLEVSGQSVDTT